MNPYLLAAIPVALLVGYYRGVAAGRDAERKRVLDGLNITQAHLLSRSLRMLRGWIEGHYTRDELSARVQEYGAEKQAEHDAECEAFVERLNKRSEKGTE